MRVFIVVSVALILSSSAQAQFLGKSGEDWKRELESGEDARRRSAAFALGKIGSASAATALKQAVLTDASPKVRDAAAYALGEIALRDVRLGKDRDVADTLTRALGDEEPLVRRSAAYALGCLGGDAAASRPAVEKVLGDRRPEVRQSAAWALGRLGDQAVPALHRLLTDSDPFVLRDAVNSLGQLDPVPVHDAISDLARLADHRDAEVRKAALRVMVRVAYPADGKSSAITTPLQKALNDGDLENRRNAAYALSNIGGNVAAPAVDVLLEALTTGDLPTKCDAAAALSNIGPAAARAVPELITCLKDPSDKLRASATLGLGGIGKRAEAAVPALVELVADKRADSELRSEAAKALSMIGEVKPAADAVPDLLAIAADPSDHPKVRERALWSIRVHNVSLRDMPSVRPAFLKILTEPAKQNSRMVRQDCAYLASMIYGPRAPAEVFPVLLEYLKDDTLKVYRSTSTSVGGTSSESTAGKTSTQEVGEGDGRKLALDALEQIGPAIVRGHPEILAQIRSLADSERVVPIFRKQCRDYLKTVQ